MIKKIFKYAIILVSAIVLLMGSLFVYTVYINPKSPKDIVSYEKESIHMEVHYSRPYKKERLIFGTAEDQALVSFGKYWRLGANFATRLETTKPAHFAGRAIEAGSYRMYAIPYSDHWIVALNSDSKGFGYNVPDQADDVMRVNIATKQLSESLEQFTIDFVSDEDDETKNVGLRMRWDTTMVTVPIGY